MSDFNSYLKDKFPLQVVDEIDDTVVFDIVNRTIIPNNVVDIVVQGDNDSRNIKYRIQKKFENVDLSSKSIVIRYTTPDNESDESFATNLVSEIDFITFEWSISAGVTVESGTVTYDILFYDNDGYKWHTKPATLNVEKGLKTTIIKPQPTTDWIDSWRAEAGNILTQCRNAEAISQQAVDAVKDVEVIKDKVVESSLLATESAIVAENQAERAKSEADRAESIVGFSGSYGDLIDLPNIEGKLLVPGENTYQSLGIQPAGNYVTLLEQTLLDNRVTDIENSYMSKELYDPNKKGIVNRASIADTALSAESIDWDGVENKPQKYTPDSHTHSNYESQISELDAACATLQDGLETANTELGNKANKFDPLKRYVKGTVLESVIAYPGEVLGYQGANALDAPPGQSSFWGKIVSVGLPEYYGLTVYFVRNDGGSIWVRNVTNLSWAESQWTPLATATPPQKMSLPLATGKVGEASNYRKDQFGRVTIYLEIKRSDGANFSAAEDAFLLPIDCAPAVEEKRTIEIMKNGITAGFCHLHIYPNGVARLLEIMVTADATLSEIGFYV